ncbi:MAG: hypothetical protein KatS3mg129_0325 [Leptospiraceae bacterium]|nr:MAG: hypothetical protein KatS3mg129_0325 [Leptospiraceae bacterium]
MAINKEQLENFLEGLDNYDHNYFFPLDQTLKNDIESRLKQKEPDIIQKYQKLFPFPLVEIKTEEKESIADELNHFTK